jgi:methionine-rich copper-binding protein CopC
MSVRLPQERERSMAWFALHARLAFLTLTLLPACAEAQRDAANSSVAPLGDARSILVSARPAIDQTVKAPVEELVLQFSPPASLIEVTVTGPEGSMPMMISPVGEAENYSLPLPSLGPGAYKVQWRASSGGAFHAGSFGFTVE